MPVLANEKVEVFARTYCLDHPTIKMKVGDVREVDAKELRELVAEFGEIDLIAGGPPCQGFSVNAPIRSLDDPRNHLFEVFLRVVAEIRPKAVLIENVPGIVSLGKGTVVEQIYKTLEALGYKVKHRILFAGHYGAPQLLLRTIFLAVRDYSGEILSSRVRRDGDGELPEIERALSLPDSIGRGLDEAQDDGEGRDWRFAQDRRR